MMNYLVQVNLFWLLLYGCYWLVLSRHTFFAWNRAYLLGSLLLAFVLPLVPYPEGMPQLPDFFDFASLVEEEAVEVGEADLLLETYAAMPTNYAPEAAAPATSAPVLGWAKWLVVLYGLGFVFMAARLLSHLRGVYAFFRKSPCLDMDAYRLYLLDDDEGTEEASPGDASLGAAAPGSFSFLNHIVITRRDYEENFDTVLNHELAHVRQRHSLDVLLMEGLRVVFWFNPILVFYKKSLQQVHEYLADREVCAWEATPGDASPGDASPRDSYAEFMVSYALATPNAERRAVDLVNPFIDSKLLKNRIVMLYKNKNSNWSLGKYAAVALFVGFVSLLAASCDQKTGEDSEQNTSTTDQNIRIEGVVLDAKDEPLPGTSIVVKGTQVGTTTTAEGEFRITAPAGSTLDFSFMGHKPTSAQMSEQGFIKVVLADENASENSVARRMSSEVGESFVTEKLKDKTSSDYLKDSVFTVVDTQPKFPGGIEAMYKFIGENMKYPAAARRALVQGKVFLTFVVNADGSVQDIKVLKGMGFGTDEEAVRIMKQTPKWIPGA
ncbi:TonB family protein, partial [Persicitalea sp.]|uniref:TonB family protein n=1 Tax=Persicitalea sp. TaxID=3100273 RepID=UPI0035934129